MASFEDFLGEKFGSDPIIGGFIDSPAEKARAEQVKDVQHTAEQYQKYRPHSQGALARQKKAMAGALGPLNALVQEQTGESIDLGAMMNQRMVSPEMMMIGAPRGYYDTTPDITPAELAKESTNLVGDVANAGSPLGLFELDWW